MSNYDYLSLSKVSIPMPIVGKMVESALTTERIASWDSFYPEAMSILESEATVDSVFYSNAVELITNDRQRVKQLIEGSDPVNEHDLKIIGYYKARKFVYDTYSRDPFSYEYLMKLHSILMAGYDENAGKIRTENSPHRGYGTMTAVSYDIDHTEVEERLKELCKSAESTIRAGCIDRLLLITSVVSDFQSLSPFLNGNGRMYRLIAEYLMLRTGILAVRYMSVDKELYMDIKRHADAIHRSSVKKDDGMKDYLPFMISYLDGICRVNTNLNLMFP